jgi:hypothetical protein
MELPSTDVNSVSKSSLSIASLVFERYTVTNSLKKYK